MNLKSVFYKFEAKDIFELKKYLNEMLDKGWMFDGFFLNGYLRFKRIKKKDIQYLVTLQETTKAKKALQNEMVDFFEKGYKYIDCSNGIVIYYSDNNYENIEKLEKIDLYSRMKYYTGKEQGTTVLLWWMIFLNLCANDNYKMSSGKTLWILQFVCIIAVIILTTITFIGNLIWKRKIENCIENDLDIKFLTLENLKMKMIISNIMSIVLISTFIFIVVFCGDIFFIIYAIAIFGFLLLIDFTQNILKRKYRKENKLIPDEINFGAMIFLVLALLLGALFYTGMIFD